MRHKRFTLLNQTKSVRSNLTGLKLSAVLVLFPGLGLTGLQAQTMYVEESGGTQTAYTLSNIQKMSFSSENLTVTKTDNSSSMYALSDLRYLYFSDNTTGLNKPLLSQSQLLRVYPNPVNNILNIDLTGITKAEGTLSILNVEGKTVVSQQVSNAGVLSIDISHLLKGFYLCRFSNATEVKTIKIIKQ